MAAVVVVGVIGALIGIVIQRRRRAAAAGSGSGFASKPGMGGAGLGVPVMSAVRGGPANDSGANVPFMHPHSNESSAYMGTPAANASSLSLTGTAYNPEGGHGGHGVYTGVKGGASQEFDVETFYASEAARANVAGGGVRRY